MRTRIIRSGLALGLWLYAAAPALKTGASAGDVDTRWGGFGTAGLVETSIPGSLFQTLSTKAGLVGVGTDGDDMIVASFTDQGQIDHNLGGAAGYFTIDLGGVDVASAVTNDVRYVAGTSNDRVVVVRLSQSGLDPAFGDGGMVDLGLARSDQDRPIAVLATDTRVWVARIATQACPTAPCPRAFSIHSLSPDGQTTLTWTSTFGADAVLRAVTRLPNGDLVAAGTRCALVGGSCQGLLARYHATNGPIAAFGTGGYRLVPEATSFSAVTAVIDGPGASTRIYAAGSIDGGLGLMRFSDAGVTDTAFFGDGTASTSPQVVTYANVVQPLSNGKWLVGGADGARYAMAVFDPGAAAVTPLIDGDLGPRGLGSVAIDEIWYDFGGPVIVGTADRSGSRRLILSQHLATGEWSTGGWWTGQFAPFDDAPIESMLGATTAPGGRLIAAIDSSGGGGVQGAYIARLDNGSVASESGGTTANGPHFVDIATAPDGQIALAGWAPTTGGGTAFIVSQRRPDLELDDAFQDGQVTVPFLGRDMARALAYQADGKLVVVGETQGTGPVQMAIVRLTSIGLRDTAFGSDGKIIAGFGHGARAYDVAIDRQGRILVAGHAFANTGAYHLLLARFDTTGALDASFGVGGVVHDLAVPFDAGYLSVEDDGRILVAGNSVPDPNAQLIARYLPDGQPDASFNGTGQILLRASGFQIRGLAEQQGRVWAVLGQVDGQGPARLQRYTADGEPDLSFSQDGLAEVGLSGGFDVRGLSIGGDRIFVWGGAQSALGSVAVIGAVETGLNRLYLPVLRR